MKRIALPGALLLALLLTGASVGKPPRVLFATIAGACNASREGDRYVVTNSSSSTACNGAGATATSCVCHGGQWAPEGATSSSGSSAFSDITSGTAVGKSFAVGDGSAVVPTGTGQIRATIADGLTADPPNCPNPGDAAAGIGANGAAQGCFTPVGGGGDMEKATYDVDNNSKVDAGKLDLPACPGATTSGAPVLRLPKTTETGLKCTPNILMEDSRVLAINGATFAARDLNHLFPFFLTVDPFFSTGSIADGGGSAVFAVDGDPAPGIFTIQFYMAGRSGTVHPMYEEDFTSVGDLDNYLGITGTPDANNFLNGGGVWLGSTGSGNLMRANGAINVTFDTEASGNAFGAAIPLWFAAAGCAGSTPAPLLDTPVLNAPSAACTTGSSVQKGVLDFDATTDESAQVGLKLPADFNASGNIDVAFKWKAVSVTGSVVWTAQIVCVADGETDDPAFLTAGIVADAAKGTTLQTNDATIANLTKTGCAAGELLQVRIARDADNGSDTMVGDARLLGIEITYRRTL